MTTINEDRLTKVEQGFVTVVELLKQHSDTLTQHWELLKQNSELLAEVRRDAQRTQRLWVRLAQKYGWIEEEDWDSSSS